MLIGILPLVNNRHANFLHHEVPGISIPEATMARMEQAGENGPRAGVEIAIELINAMRDVAQGIYLMPAFSRYDLTAEVIEAVK
jgi:homocysteine S-methyltransferase